MREEKLIFVAGRFISFKNWGKIVKFAKLEKSLGKEQKCGS